jgi:protein-serine/threonine kinase
MAPRPSLSANKNRHTIQVEYDETASYEPLHAGMDDERVSRNREELAVSTATLPPSPNPDSSPTKQVLQLQEGDFEMDSASSDQGHTLESFTQAVSDGIRTPPPSTPSAPRLLEQLPEGEATPTTPSRKGKDAAGTQLVSPSTPRATKAELEDITTPRARPAHDSSLPQRTPRSEGKRYESIPAERTTPPREAVAFPRPVLPEPKFAKAPPPSRRERYRKGMSLDKFGLAKLLGSNQAASNVDLSQPPPPSSGAASAVREEGSQPVRRGSMRPRPAEGDGQKDKKSKRRTLQLMVNR